MQKQFQQLTTEVMHAKQEATGYIAVGLVRQIAKNTLIYLHADRNEDKTNERYEPSINVYSFGQPITPMANDPFCFDLTEQANMLLCVRGLRFDDKGLPEKYLVETYRPVKTPVLRLVNS